MGEGGAPKLLEISSDSAVLFRVLRIIPSHLGMGLLSSAPSTFPVLSGTTS